VYVQSVLVNGLVSYW